MGWRKGDQFQCNICKSAHLPSNSELVDFDRAFCEFMSGFEEQYAILSIVQRFQLREGWADKALAMEARPRQRQSGGPPT